MNSRQEKQCIPWPEAWKVDYVEERGWREGQRFRWLPKSEELQILCWDIQSCAVGATEISPLPHLPMDPGPMMAGQNCGGKEGLSIRQMLVSPFLDMDQRVATTGWGAGQDFMIPSTPKSDPSLSFSGRYVYVSPSVKDTSFTKVSLVFAF